MQVIQTDSDSDRPHNQYTEKQCADTPGRRIAEHVSDNKIHVVDNDVSFQDKRITQQYKHACQDHGVFRKKRQTGCQLFNPFQEIVAKEQVGVTACKNQSDEKDIFIVGYGGVYSL